MAYCRDLLLDQACVLVPYSKPKTKSVVLKASQEAMFTRFRILPGCPTTIPDPHLIQRAGQAFAHALRTLQRAGVPAISSSGLLMEGLGAIAILALLFLSHRPPLATRLLAHKIQSPQEWEAIQALTVRREKGCL